MLFERRYWARLVANRIGVHHRSREGELLVGMCLWASKESDRIAKRAVGWTLPKRDSILAAAIGMARNNAAVAEVARRLGLEPKQSLMLLDRYRRAAIDIADAHGLTQIADQGRRDRIGMRTQM